MLAQTLSQFSISSSQSQSVPEPGAIAGLTMLGLAGLGYKFKNRRRYSVSHISKVH
ncbi:MAG: PEP-CTERM sorting domain-containing protein [Hydrococcus sp. RU_2_2]|nr:PEP-CTERM sorting domain-containing protein [Hydrococcus sp. RU_2_2]NJP20440.1 PEP-CTERM sorting domain-containing protein [Hydrococcus sp. CRU_1_1]